jgi:hypothetical protein
VVVAQALLNPFLSLPEDNSTAEASQPSQLSQPSQAGQVEVPPAVRAHAWITLGKLCLVDEALAKRCLPFFIQVGWMGR